MLYKVLDLPEFLLSPMVSSHSSSSHSHSQSHNKTLRNGLWRRQSSSTSSRTGSTNSVALDPGSPIDLLHPEPPNSSTPLNNTLLDVFRIFTQHKFICFCLDDLQFADEESLELLTQVLSAEMQTVLIVTYPSEESLPEKIRSLIELGETEGKQ